MSTSVGTLPETKLRVRVAPRRDAEPRVQPPYCVILYNDDINGFDHVIRTLQKVFRYSFLEAFRLTVAAHTTGRSMVWSGMLEVAELKAQQVHGCGPDPVAGPRAAPLRVGIEPMA